MVFAVVAVPCMVFIIYAFTLKASVGEENNDYYDFLKGI